MKSRLLATVFSLTAIYAATSLQANATTIDFTTVPTGTAVTNQYAGVTFSLAGGVDSAGAPTVGRGGLTNTRYSGAYPTAEFLIATFAPTVKDVSFTFNNAGYNGANNFALYNASHALIAGGAMSGSGDVFYDLSSYTGISEIQWSNGRATNNWWQKLDSVSFTQEASKVPEPGSLALFGLGLAGFAVLRRQRNR
ncbi:MAG: PEP-CTERM sorting domain-containing protein [Pseudomonadota bacterium]|nr:PEP-CTERM sorting domain-containing protein [Pseudomonadota bacterium]